MRRQDHDDQEKISSIVSTSSNRVSERKKRNDKRKTKPKVPEWYVDRVGRDIRRRRLYLYLSDRLSFDKYHRNKRTQVKK